MAAFAHCHLPGTIGLLQSCLRRDWITLRRDDVEPEIEVVHVGHGSLTAPQQAETGQKQTLD